MTAISSGFVPLAYTYFLRLLPAQACNNLVDLDADELISAACLVYAELIQKDVSCPTYLSFSSSFSKKPSLTSNLSPWQVYSASETVCATLSVTNPQGFSGVVFPLFAHVTLVSSSRLRFPKAQPSSVVPCVNSSGSGPRTEHPGTQESVTGWMN